MTWVFSQLQEDVLELIFEYISPFVKFRLNRALFNQYHPYVVQSIPDRFYRNYLAYVTKHDMSFTMASILKSDINRLGKIRIFRFGGFEYHTQHLYVKMLSKRFNSHKIAHLLDDIPPAKSPVRAKRYRDRKKPKTANQWKN